MFELTNLPIEMIDKILCYEQQMIQSEHFNALKDTLIIQAAIKRFSYDNHDPFDKTIMDFNEASIMISLLGKCNCCNRHINRKPGLDDLTDGFVPEYSLSNCNLNDCNCKCKCRHVARHICRLYNEEVDDSDNDNDNDIVEVEEVDDLHSTYY